MSFHAVTWNFPLIFHFHAAMRILKQAARSKLSLLNVEGNSNELKHEERIGFLFVYNRIILLQQIKSKGR